MKIPILYRLVLLFLLIATPAFAAGSLELDVPDFDGKPVSKKKNVSLEVVVTNQGEDPVRFIWISVEKKDNQGQFRNFRTDIVCDCDKKCNRLLIELKKGEWRRYRWDFLGNDCKEAPSGVYRFNVNGNVSTEFEIGKGSSTMASRYSPLWKRCAAKHIKIEEGYEAVEARCRGDAGYDLLLGEEDIRQSVTVISPDGRRHPLELDRVVSGAPSFLGEKAEWRRQKIGGKLAPFALIIRFTASSYEEGKTTKTSYLTVSKITPEKICVTDVIPPGRDQNELARQAGDRAAKKPCL